jgi:Flp pilus assembly protein TadB
MSKNSVPQIGGRGGIQTNWKDIRWTSKKLIAVTSLLTLPYLATVVATFVAGMTVISLIMSGVAVFVGIIFVLVRWLEKANL